ncbi:MAG: helix-turn-helix transcriptional regulator [Phycisphaerae bacterium]|nr:helix-turn-helix transcriptional regulator [Phycisphaerae bacterium]
MQRVSLQTLEAVLGERRDLALSLARLHGESFAAYVVELLALLGGAAEGDREAEAPVEEAAPASADVLDDAPDWVKEAYQESCRPDAQTDDDATVRARVVRNKLLQALRKQGWSQAELARRMGVSATVISRIFRKPERCKITTLRKVSGKLKVHVSDLI